VPGRGAKEQAPHGARPAIIDQVLEILAHPGAGSAIRPWAGSLRSNARAAI
jgi:hypothetical protein